MKNLANALILIFTSIISFTSYSSESSKSCNDQDYNMRISLVYNDENYSFLSSYKTSKEAQNQLYAYGFRFDEDSKKITELKMFGTVKIISDSVLEIKIQEKTAFETGMTRLTLPSRDSNIAILLSSSNFTHLTLEEASKVIEQQKDFISLVFPKSRTEEIRKEIAPATSCTCKGAFGGSSCCTSPTCNIRLGLCQSHPDCKQVDQDGCYLTRCNCNED